MPQDTSLIGESIKQLSDASLKAKQDLKDNEAFRREVFKQQTRFEHRIWWFIIAGSVAIIIGVATLGVASLSLGFGIWKLQPPSSRSPQDTNSLKPIDCNCQDQVETAVAIKSLEKEIRNLKFTVGIKKDIADLNNEQKTANCSIQKLEKEIQNLVGKIKELEDTIQDERLARSIVNEQLLNDLSRDTTIEKILESLSDTIEKSQH